MGQTHESPLSDEKQLTKMFSIQGRVKEHNLTYLQHLQTHKQYLLRQTTFTEQLQQLEMLTTLKQRQGFSSRHLTNLIKYQHSKKEDLCSKHYRLHSLWEYPRRTLAQEINERALVKQPFPPGEIRSLIRQISEGMRLLQQQHLPHGCLTSKTILVEGPNHFRVVDRIASPVSDNLDVIYHKRSVKNIYLSPEQCDLIDQDRVGQALSDPYRSDVFTAGMLVLESGLLQRQDDCYQDDCSRVNGKRLLHNLGLFGDVYGHELRQCLERMLVREPGQRIDWGQLSQQMDMREQEMVVRVSNVGQSPISNGESTLGKSLAFSYQNGNRTVQGHGQGHMRPSVGYRRVPEANGLSPVTRSVMQPIRRTDFPATNSVIRVLEPVQRTIHPLNGSAIRSSERQPHVSSQIAPQSVQRVLYAPPPPSPLPPPQQTIQPSGIFHYPPAIDNIKELPKDPVIRTNSKTEHSSQPNNSNYPAKLESPQAQPSQPAEFDQTEPTYSVDEFKNGGRYEGYKSKGKREGWGKYIYQEGGCYEGEWRNDLMCGRGKLFYQSGKIAYQGYLENDLFHGIGTLFNEQPQTSSKPFNYHNFQEIEQFWLSYQGQFRQDKKEGHGKLTLSNGQILEGSFHEDKVEGQCQFRTTAGELVRGIWHQNIFQRQL